jgi:hypothetical protein
MKSILGILIWLFPFQLFAQDSSELRTLYLKSIESEFFCDSLLTLCEQMKGEDDPIISGYHSAILIIKAKHRIDPIKKLSLFTKGKRKLDALILTYPQLTELRILRLTLQKSVPKFLGYDHNIDADEQHIFAELDRIRLYENFFGVIK